METRLVDVALLPCEMEKIRAEGFAAVVIDVLRASTTIITALANGAARVIPLTTVEEARARREKEPGALLGGERNAVPPPGFDLGNSPREHTPERVKDKTIILTTTNGTRACEAAEKAGAKAVVIGSFINQQAVVDFCRSFPGPLLFVCAGCQGRFSLEDSLYAGAVISKLGEGFHLSDGARTCLTLYERWQDVDLTAVIAGSIHGQRLEGLGFGEDIRLAAALDSHPVLPIYWDSEIRLEPWESRK